jgi:hypothetical protein
LVVHDPKLIAFSRQPQHRQEKIASAVAKHPAGAKYQMPTTRVPDRFFAFRLSFSVLAQRRDWIALNISL